MKGAIEGYGWNKHRVVKIIHIPQFHQLDLQAQYHTSVFMSFLSTLEVEVSRGMDQADIEGYFLSNGGNKQCLAASPKCGGTWRWMRYITGRLGPDLFQVERCVHIGGQNCPVL